MQITNEIKLQLQRIANCSAPPPHQVTLDLATGTLQCVVTAIDAIGCAVESVRLNFDEQHGCSMEKMRKLADVLCHQLRYLVEPLQVIEVDNDQPLVQARSQPPSQDATRTVNYYELLVAPRSLSLVRFSAPRGEPRKAIPMQLTREILTRLLQDLVNAA